MNTEGSNNYGKLNYSQQSQLSVYLVEILFVLSMRLNRPNAKIRKWIIKAK